tara:strand:+ start:17697 stop:18077 length:381 start_codon:yes stop_codon:yes gene_type:complete
MKEGILEGLKNALAKGESLQYAMQSFHNAGYSLNDIQGAARELQSKIPQQNNYNPNPTNVQEKPKAPQVNNGPPIQRVSSYEQGQSNPRKIVVIIIAFLLLLLVLSVVAIFFFRENILTFLNNLIS